MRRHERRASTHLIFLRAAADIAKARRGRGRTDAAHCNRTGARARPSIWRRSLARCSLRLVACPRQDAALFGRRLLPADGTGELSVSSEFTALWPLAISTAADRSRRSPADQPSEAISKGLQGSLWCRACPASQASEHAQRDDAALAVGGGATPNLAFEAALGAGRGGKNAFILQ